MIVLSLAVNFVVIFGAIVLFMTPFFGWYYWHHRQADATLSQHLRQFFSSKYVNGLVFLWAFGEALVWFVIPEFLLLLAVFMRVNKKRDLLLFDIAGTFAGTLVALVIHLPPDAIAKLPYVQPAMITHAQEWFSQFGVFGLVFQPFSGVPYKVFAYLAADFNFFVPLLLLFAVLVRVSRYYIAYVVFTLAYPALHRFVYRNYVPLFVAATAVFSLLLYRVYMAYA